MAVAPRKTDPYALGEDEWQDETMPDVALQLFHARNETDSHETAANPV